MGFREWCSVFCCPPLPSSIVSKLAFVPPEATYSFKNVNEGKYSVTLCQQDEVECNHCDLDINVAQGVYADTKRGNKIACIYVKCSSSAKYTVLFSHGNAVDLGHMCSFFYNLGTMLNCNVLGYDYSGYGLSSGKPSEKNIYADIEAAVKLLNNQFGTNSHSIILYGQSIGTVPTVDLASKNKFAAVILHSPLTSGMRLVFPKTKRTWFFDAFPSIDKVSKIETPTLVIHGTDDEIVDFRHGCLIFENCPTAVSPLWIEGAGHSDVEMYPIYFERLTQFVNEDVRKCEQGQCTYCEAADKCFNEHM